MHVKKGVILRFNKAARDIPNTNTITGCGRVNVSIPISRFD